MDDIIRRSPGRLVAGIIFVAVGIVFFLDTMGLAAVPNVGRLWPLVLVAIGLTQIRGRLFTGSVAGHVLLALGIIFLLENYGVVRHPFRYFWPALLIFVGLRIVMGPMAVFRREESTDPSATVSAFCAFSGVDRRITSQEFRGGDLGAFCGGWDLDLRKAGMAGSEAVIDVFCWWGGGEIKVPQDWDVVVRVLPLFGGVSDKTTHPVPQPGVPPKRLVLTGTAIMGGVEVKN